MHANIVEFTISRVKSTFCNQKLLNARHVAHLQPFRSLAFANNLNALTLVVLKAMLDIPRDPCTSSLLARHCDSGEVAGVAILWIEHVVHALLAVIDRLVVLNFGRKIAEGAPREVMQLPEVHQIYIGIEA